MGQRTQRDAPRRLPVYTRPVRSHEWIERRSLALHEAVAATLETQHERSGNGLAAWRLPAADPCATGPACRRPARATTGIAGPQARQLGSARFVPHAFGYPLDPSCRCG